MINLQQQLVTAPEVMVYTFTLVLPCGKLAILEVRGAANQEEARV